MRDSNFCMKPTCAAYPSRRAAAGRHSAATAACFLITAVDSFGLPCTHTRCIGFQRGQPRPLHVVEWSLRYRARTQVCRFLSEVPPARKEAAAAAAAAGEAAGPHPPDHQPSPPLNNDPHYAASQLVQYAINAADSDDVSAPPTCRATADAVRQPRLLQCATQRCQCFWHGG